MDHFALQDTFMTELVELGGIFGRRYWYGFEHPNRPPDELLAAIAAHTAGSPVAVDDAPRFVWIVRIDQEDVVGGMLEKVTEALLAFTQHNLGLLAGGDIPVDAQHQLAPINLYERCR